MAIDPQPDAVIIPGQDVSQADMLALLNDLVSTMEAFQAQDTVVYATETAMNADLSPAADTVAIAADTLKVYTKVGASGAGSWSLTSNVIADQDTAITAATTTANTAAAAVQTAVREAMTGALPPDLLGLWYVDQAETNGLRQSVPNLAHGNNPANLFTPSRHMFNNATYWLKFNGATVTDDSETGPNGLTDAALVSGGATDWSLSHNYTTLPAGTYTLVVSVESGEGSDFDFKTGLGSDLDTVTAPASGYVRRTSTFTTTTTGANIFIINTVGSAAGSVRLHEVALYEGSVDLGAENLVGDILFGADAHTNQPTISGGYMTMTGSSPAIAQWDDYQDLSEFTAVVIGKRNDVPPGVNQYQMALAAFDSVSRVNQLGVAMSDGVNSGPLALFGADSVTFAAGEVIGGYLDGLWNPDDDVPMALATRYSNADGQMTIWRNDIRAVEATSAGLTTSVRDLAVGSLFGGAAAKYDFAAIALWRRALTDDELRRASWAMRDHVRRASSIEVTERRFLCAEGDSITRGQGATTSYAYDFGANASPAVDGVVPATSTATLLEDYAASTGNSLEARIAYIDGMIPPNKQGRTFVLSVLVGNDFVTGFTDAAAYAVKVGEYCAARKAAGWDKVVLINILPRTTAGFNTWRNAVNAAFAASGFDTTYSIDAICDFAGEATVGGDAAASNATHYPDGVHPSDAAHALLEVVYRATINGL
ncbi:MAG: SGNH/GDSL hydrolase family protein [Minwuia sp.]|nr:SGNH/GDSL hydrolase family protein [Minwuia sp.]